MTNMDEEEEKRRALVEKRAYEIYESRGGHHGYDREDWDQALREVEADGTDALPPADDDDEVEETPGTAA